MGAEMRLHREAEAARKKSEYERKKAEYEEQKAARAVGSRRRSVKQIDWDAKSDTSQATVSTAVPTMVFNVEEVRHLAAKDKQVLKLSKVLREIAKLQERQDLDALQKAKVARKSQVEEELETARGLAEARVRNELKQQD